MRLLSFILAATISACFARAETVSVAAAANLSFALKPLNAAFEKDNPGVEVTTTTAATGNLVAMIEQGAPYDVLLSADLDFPRRLITSGAGVRESLVTFAYGKLVIWTTKPGIALTSVESLVRDPAVRRIAVANPKTAPFGRAAEQALAKLGLTAAAAPKLVFGENISQTAQFVSSGNADAGFVALSLLLGKPGKNPPRYLKVPVELYTPLPQGAVLTRRGASKPAAARYLAFLQSAAAGEILALYGYGLP